MDDWQAAVAVLGGMVGLAVGVFTLWDRTIGARRLAIRHVTARTHRSGKNSIDGSGRAGDLVLVVSNDGRLPVNLSRVWFGAPRHAQRFLGADGQWHHVDELVPEQAVAPAEFEVLIQHRDRRVPPGESLSIHIQDWVSRGAPADQARARDLFGQKYNEVLRPAPSSVEETFAILGYGADSRGELEVGVEIVDYNGLSWNKIGLDYWRQLDEAPSRLRLRWYRWIETRSSFLWIEPRLVAWAVAGAASGSRLGWIRAALVSRVVGWRIGPGSDRRRYKFLPRTWGYGELPELALDPARSRRHAAVCRETYVSLRKYRGRPPTRQEFSEELDNRLQNKDE